VCVCVCVLCLREEEKRREERERGRGYVRHVTVSEQVVIRYVLFIIGSRFFDLCPQRAQCGFSYAKMCDSIINVIY
jgi:hypothetical protein